MIERSGPFGRAGRRSVVITCVSLLCASMAFTSFTAGCGEGGAVKNYIAEANQILTEVNTKAGEIKKYWVMPLADQAGMQKALADYRKALAKAQDKLDSTDSPQACVKLDDLLRKVLDNGRELADLATPYGDYVDNVAPMANLATALVDELEALEDQKDIPSGLAGLTEKARKLETDLRTVNPPSAFTGMHQEFQEFARGMLIAFEKASKGASSDTGQRYTETQPLDEDEDEDIETTSPRGQTSTQPSSSRNRQVQPLLEDIPGDWARFEGQLSEMLDIVRQVSGLAGKNAEVEALIGQAVAEIQSLEKRYK